MSLAALARSAPRLAAVVGQRSGLLATSIQAGLSTPLSVTAAAATGTGTPKTYIMLFCALAFAGFQGLSVRSDCQLMFREPQVVCNGGCTDAV